MAQTLSQSHSRAATLRVEVLKTLAQFRALREQWQHLFRGACNASPPLHFDWLMSWLEVYGGQYVAGADGLRIVCVRRGDELVAGLPLYLRRPQEAFDGGTHLRFVSTGEYEQDEVCADYLDMLCLPDVRVDASDMVGAMVLGELSGEYDRVVLQDMSDASVMAEWARRNHALGSLQVRPRGVCPLAEISGGLEGYLGRLSANTRQQCRRLLRAGQKAGVIFEVASTHAEVDEYFAQLIELHQARWIADGQSGCFASRQFTDFHRELVKRWHSQGMAILGRLRIGTDPLAVKYGFRIGGKFDFYQSGVSLRQWPGIKSPGILSFLLLMDYLSSTQVTTFDFLRGASSYKNRLETAAQPLMEVRRVRWTWPTIAGVVGNLATRVLRRAGRIVLRRGRSHAVLPAANDAPD